MVCMNKDLITSDIMTKFVYSINDYKEFRFYNCIVYLYRCKVFVDEVYSIMLMTFVLALYIT